LSRLHSGLDGDRIAPAPGELLPNFGSIGARLQDFHLNLTSSGLAFIDVTDDFFFQAERDFVPRIPDDDRVLRFTCLDASGPVHLPQSRWCIVRSGAIATLLDKKRPPYHLLP